MTQHCIDAQYWHGRLSPRRARNYENYWAGFAHHADSNGVNPDWLPLSHFDLRELDETGMIRPSVQYATTFCPEVFYDAGVQIPAWKVEAHKVYDERMREKLEANEKAKRETAALKAYQKARAEVSQEAWRESMAEARQRFLEKEEIRRQQHAARAAEEERKAREHEVLLQLEIHQREINFALHWFNKRQDTRHTLPMEFLELEAQAALLVPHSKDANAAAWWGGYMQGLRTWFNVAPALSAKIHEAWMDPERFPDEIRKSKSRGYVAGYNKLLTAP